MHPGFSHACHHCVQRNPVSLGMTGGAVYGVLTWPPVTRLDAQTGSLIGCQKGWIRILLNSDRLALVVHGLTIMKGCCPSAGNLRCRFFMRFVLLDPGIRQSRSPCPKCYSARQSGVRLAQDQRGILSPHGNGNDEINSGVKAPIRESGSFSITKWRLANGDQWFWYHTAVMFP